MKRFTLVIALIVSLWGCQNNSTSSESGVGSDFNITGDWVGTLFSKFAGTVTIDLTIAQQDKIQIEDQQESRQVISGVITFKASDCYSSGTIDSAASRIDGNAIHLAFIIGGDAVMIFQGFIVSPTRISGDFTSDVICTVISPIVTTDSTMTSTTVEDILDGDGTVTGSTVTTETSGGVETTGGGPEPTAVTDGGRMVINRR